MTLYRQCALSQGNRRITGWIEDRAAKAGASVEVKDDAKGSFWTVEAVYEHAMTSEQLTEHKRMHRGSLPSIDPMAPA